MTPRPLEPELTVVIPTLGRTILRESLAALAAGEVLPRRVIVVDQGRRPEIRAITRDIRAGGLDVVYLPSGRRGRSAGLNSGLARVDTAYVAITDDDCTAAPDWIARLAARLRAHRRAIITGRVEAGGHGVQLAVAPSTEPVIQKRPSFRFDRLSGGNMALSMALMRELGPFEEDPCMRTAEDAEYAYRALRAGVPLVYAPEVWVRHLGWRDTGERDAQYLSYGYSLAGFFGRYLRRADLFIAVRAAYHLGRSLKRWIAGLLTGDGERARNGRAYVLGFLPGLVAGLRAGRREARQ